MAARRKRNVRRKRTRRRARGKRMSRVRSHSAYAGSILPNRKNFVFKYADSINNVAISSNPIATHTFRANSLFDPDFSETGHQPLGFDEIKDMYEEFHVIGSKIKVTFFEGSATTGVPLLLFVLPQASNGLNANLQTASDIMEYAPARWKILRKGDIDGYARGYPKVITHQMSLPKFLGKRIGFLASDTDKCTATANPTEQVAWVVGIATMNDGIVAQNVDFAVELEYIAIGHEPKVLVRS